MPRHAIRALAFACAILLFVGSVAGAAERSVIVGLKSRDAAASESSSAAAGLVPSLAAQGADATDLPLINAVKARLDETQIAPLRARSDVRYVVADGTVATPERLAGDAFPDAKDANVQGQATPAEFYNWGAERVRVPDVHRAESARSSGPMGLALALGLSVVGALMCRGRRRPVMLLGLGLVAVPVLAGCTQALVMPHNSAMGDGVQVATLDTGADLDHPDLNARIRGGVDLVNRDDDPADDNGHGSGVAGILAASENGRGLVGAAPDVGVWVVKMLRYDEQGSISDLVRGIEWAAERGADIINMSLGTDEDNPALRDAVEAAHDRGILMVSAVGNTGERVLYPAAYPEVVAVASTNRQDRRAWFSNQGSEVELTAPGIDLITTGQEGDYQVQNGTSFSVPFVTGTAALLMSSGVRDLPDVRRRLRQSAEDLGLALSAQGHGLVDAERAVLQSD